MMKWMTLFALCVTQAAVAEPSRPDFHRLVYALHEQQLADTQSGLKRNPVPTMARRRRIIVTALPATTMRKRGACCRGFSGTPMCPMPSILPRSIFTMPMAS